MRRKMILFLTLCHAILFTMLLASFPVFAIFPGQSALYWRSLFLILPTLLTDWGVRHLKHLLSYLLLLALCIASIFLYSQDLIEQIYLCAITALIGISRIPARIKGQPDWLQSPGYLCLIAFSVSYFAGLISKSTEMPVVVYYLTFAYLLVIILYTNLSNVDYYLEENRNIANLPGKQILSTNRIMLTIFSGITILGMLILPVSGLNQVLLRLKDALIALIRWLFSLAPDSKVEQVIEETTAASSQAPMGLPEGKESPEWLRAFFQILSTILSIAVVVLLIGALIYGIYNLFKKFYHPIEENEDKQEFLFSENREDIATREKREKKERLWFQFHPDAAVRKFYKKKLKGRFPEVPPDSSTPEELESQAGMESVSYQKELHELYEKARYSKDGCTKEEVSALKEHTRS